MKIRRYFALLLVLASWSCFAADKSEWPPGSAMHSGLSQKEILIDKQATSDELISKIHNNLEKHKPYNGEYLGRLFKKHNENWIAYVASTCMTVGTMSGAGGSWQTYHALRCETNMTDQRLFNLTNTLRCIKRHVKNKQNYQIPACLYQSFTVKY